MKKLIFAFVLLASGFAFAVESNFGVTGGFRTNNFDTDVTGATVTGKNGFQLGGLAWFNFADPLALRLGFLYSQRYAQLDQTVAGSKFSTDIKLTYLDIPLTLQYKFGDFGGVFFGPVFSMNQSKECTTAGVTGSNCTGVQSSITPLSVGVSFKFAPQMGAEFAYEFYSGKVADGLSNLRSLGANFVFFFD